MNNTRQRKLANQYLKVILYMLDKNPGSEHWNNELKQLKQLIRKLK